LVKRAVAVLREASDLVAVKKSLCAALALLSRKLQL
jgi:hypothetical protein